MSGTLNATVLIVDDTKLNVDLLVNTLSDEYDISVAMDGQTALEIAESELPDLILLDIMMPEMDGYEVCRRLKTGERTREIPIIFITAKSDEEDEIQGFELGAVDYITKPISPPKVIARVKTHLKLKEAHERLEKQNDQLREAARLREDVDSIMRHDLKSPLNGIISLPQTMIEDRKLDPEHVASLRIIQKSGLRMLNMINLSLDLFKMERGIYPFQPVPIDIQKVVKIIIDEMQCLTEAKGLSFKVQFQGHPTNDKNRFIILGEELLCYSILSNLIKNAVEASPDGEIISIVFEDREGLCISIHNQGQVPEAIRDKFFDKYATSGKREGTGLGTYSARLLTETQGGRISLASSDSKGTVISVCLPSVTEEDRKTFLAMAKIDEKTQEPEDCKLSLSSLGTRRLLIVDDDEDNIRILEKYLAHPNLAIESASNGKIAFEKLTNDHFDIVLMDIEMPVMDGYTATQKIRNSKFEIRNVPIIALTAHDDLKTQKKYLETGFSDCLTKPVHRAGLIHALFGNIQKQSTLAGAQKAVSIKQGLDPENEYTVEVDVELKDLIPSFFKKKHSELENMRQALRNSAFESLRKSGHKLKGAFGMYGFQSISDICFKIEAGAKRQDARIVKDNLAILADYLEKTIIVYVDDR
ncbi:MAG: response regulator [Desulfobacterales bacterium]|nr:response regulator [Desulfobacterales bacterium]